MHRLIAMTDPAAAAVLQDRLATASIRAVVTQEQTTAGLYVGGLHQFVVWIADEADMPRAQELLQEMLPATSSSRCPSCDYDLRGHSGTIRCPECGGQVKTPQGTIECPHCHQGVPADFEICWSCGGDLAGGESAQEGPRNRGTA